MPHFRGESSLRTFVFRIAHNRALTHVWRRRKTRRAEHPEDLLDLRANPEKKAIESANESRLLEAISELPLPLRQVITLALEELPYAEIAAVLGITENNVAVRVNRGRKLLKEKLGGRR